MKGEATEAEILGQHFVLDTNGDRASGLPESAALDMLEARPEVDEITDYLMPGMNGLASLQARMRAAPDPPILIASAYGDLSPRT